MSNNNFSGVVVPNVLNQPISESSDDNEELLRSVRGILDNETSPFSALEKNIKTVLDDTKQARLNAELNQRVLNSANKQTEIENLEKSIEDLQEKRLLFIKNQNFTETNGKWLSEVAGILGMNSYDELISEVSDELHLSNRISVSVRNAYQLVETKLKKATPDKDSLLTDFNFIHLIALYYLKNQDDGKSRFTLLKNTYVQDNIERHFFRFIKSRVKEQDLEETLLGNLQSCF